MKLNKVFKKAMLASMTLLMAASLTFTGCSSSTGSDDDNNNNKEPEASNDVYSGDEIEFKVIADSTTAENTILLIKYDRSAVGADEQISLKNVEFEVTCNGTPVTLGNSFSFQLDEYGAGFDNAPKTDGKITDPTYMKEYKIKPSLNKKVSVGDSVKVTLKKANIAGNGKDKVDLSKVLIALIDTHKDANYYKELCANTETDKNEYLPLITKKNGNPLSTDDKKGPFDAEPAADAGFSVNDTKDTFTYKLAWAPATKANVQLVFQNKELPVVGEKAEAGHDFDIKGTFALKLNDEVIWAEEEKTFTVKNNAYGDDYILKTNILSDKELKAGDVITLTAKEVKVLAKDETDAGKIKKITTTIIDDSETANWWKDLLNTEIANNTFWEGTAEVKTGGNSKPDPIVYDFTNAVTGDNVTIAGVTYCSANKDAFSTENGLTLTVSNSWEGAFKIAINSIDVSGMNCEVEYYVDEGFTLGNQAKLLIQLVSKEQSSGDYKAIELSQGEFAKTPASTFSKETIDNIYKNDWDAVSENGDAYTDDEKATYKGCDLTKVSAIKINTTDAAGTIHIKSIKFVPKSN